MHCPRGKGNSSRELPLAAGGSFQSGGSKCNALFTTQRLANPQPYLSFLWNLESVYPVSQVGGELLIQLPQALLQDLQQVLSFPQDLELLFQRNLLVLCLHREKFDHQSFSTNRKNWTYILATKKRCTSSTF